MLTKKSLNKLQSEAIKQNASNLVGAVKLYSALFSDSKDIQSICKTLELPKEYAFKIVQLAKDKKQLVSICSQMLPKIDNTFVRFQVYSKVYSDPKKKEMEVSRSNDWITENVVYGKTFKAFGFTNPVSITSEKGAYFQAKETDEYKTITVATVIKSYNIRLVAKCVSEYLSHESNEQ